MWRLLGLLLGLAGWATIGWFVAVAIGRVCNVDVESPESRARRHLQKRMNYWVIDVD